MGLYQLIYVTVNTVKTFRLAIAACYYNYAMSLPQYAPLQFMNNHFFSISQLTWWQGCCIRQAADTSWLAGIARTCVSPTGMRTRCHVGLGTVALYCRQPVALCRIAIHLTAKYRPGVRWTAFAEQTNTVSTHYSTLARCALSRPNMPT